MEQWCWIVLSGICVYIPWHSVDANLCESSPLNLSYTVNDEGRHTGDNSGTEGSQVSILRIGRWRHGPRFNMSV